MLFKILRTHKASWLLQQTQITNVFSFSFTILNQPARVILCILYNVVKLCHACTVLVVTFSLVKVKAL